METSDKGVTVCLCTWWGGEEVRPMALLGLGWLTPTPGPRCSPAVSSTSKEGWGLCSNCSENVQAP